MRNHWLQKRVDNLVTNPIVDFQNGAKFVIWGQKTLGRKPTEDPQVDRFMKELVEILDSHSEEELKGVDFKALYDKYPKVRIGIRRALYVADSIRRNLRKN
jgi:hypothetical protein